MSTTRSKPSADGPPGTIVISTRDRADRVEATVARLLDLPDAWAVIVVDDASRDDTTARLRRRFGTHIRTIRLEDNRGAAARNVGVRAADTEFVAFADDDSWWRPGSLGAASHLLREHPEVALVAASVVVEPSGEYDPIVEEFATSPLPVLAAGRTVLGFLACASVVRRAAFLDVGGFHPILHVGGEEQLLAIDLRTAGWQLVHAPHVVAHHAPESNDAGRRRRSVVMSRNRLLAAVMRRPGPVVARELAAYGRALWSGSDRSSALVSLLRRLPRALLDRRPVSPRVEHELRLIESC